MSKEVNILCVLWWKILQRGEKGDKKIINLIHVSLPKKCEVCIREGVNITDPQPCVLIFNFSKPCTSLSVVVFSTCSYYRLTWKIAWRYHCHAQTNAIRNWQYHVTSWTITSRLLVQGQKLFASLKRLVVRIG